MRDERVEGEAEFAVTVARREERRRQGALFVLQEHCRRVGLAVEELRRDEQCGLAYGYDGPSRERISAAKRTLARALRDLEEAALDPLVLSAADLAEAEEDALRDSPFP